MYEVFKFRDVELIFKRKRKIENSSQTSYKNLLLKLRLNPKFVQIDQVVSSKYIVENAKIVISMPFIFANL